MPFRLGKLVKNGFNHGQPQALCKACGGSVVLSYATAYYGLESEAAILETAVRALAEGNSIRATGRIVQVDKDTVCDWLNRAALHCRAVALYLWRQLHVTECQLDELWGFVHTKEAHLPFAKVYCETYGDAWVWLAFAPVWRLGSVKVLLPATVTPAEAGVQRLCLDSRFRGNDTAELILLRALSSASPDSSTRSRRASAFPRRPVPGSACRGRPFRALPTTDPTDSRGAGSGEAGTNRWCR